MGISEIWPRDPVWRRSGGDWLDEIGDSGWGPCQSRTSRGALGRETCPTGVVARSQGLARSGHDP